MEYKESGYKKSLEAASAIVIDYREFGSYQGDFFAIVFYNGKTSVVHGTYGSCSGCDAFKSEFNWFYDDMDESSLEYNIKLKNFGESYLHNVMTIDEALKYAEKDSSWDLEAKEMVEWIRNLKNYQFVDKLESIVE